jgi:Zn-dependent M28 family amino/carboxypeptidase
MMTLKAGRSRVLIIALLFLVTCLTGVALLVTQPVWAVHHAPAAQAVDPERLRKHVTVLSETFAPRDYTHVENLDRAAAYIHEQFRLAGGAVSEQAFVVDSQHYRNVIARFGKNAGSKDAERIVVGAHYDVCGPYPGADDNASGIAGLIELAYLLGKQELQTPVELVAYTLEEPPFFRTGQMGSAVHAESLVEEHAKLRAMLCLEMIGYFSDQPDSQEYPLAELKALYPNKGNFIALVGTMQEIGLLRRVKRAMMATNDLPLRSINAPRNLVGVDFSDHLNYWNRDFPALMITDTAFYRNKRYHHPEDVLNTLDFNRMAKVVQQVYAAVIELER